MRATADAHRSTTTVPTPLPGLGSPASVVDLFCGAGALSHGFVLEGFSVTCGFDINDICRYPFEKNNRAPFVRRDISKIDPDELAGKFPAGRPRVLVGCAPCQPFSKYTQRREDPKWVLLKDFARLISAVLPDVVSMENVPQLVRFRGGAVFGEFVSMLNASGYHVRWTIAECADFGAPQARSRLVLIGSRYGEPPLPAPTHRRDEHVTVRAAIGEMPPLAAGETDPCDPLHRTSRMSDLNLRRIRASTPGGSWLDWDESLVAACHRRNTGRSYTSIYGRLRWDRPAPTITTQFHGFGNGRFGHPEQDRALSLREGALLQTFPREYEFSTAGTALPIKELGRMIGNAVPVALARAIARAIADHLEEQSCPVD